MYSLLVGYKVERRQKWSWTTNIPHQRTRTDTPTPRLYLKTRNVIAKVSLHWQIRIFQRISSLAREREGGLHKIEWNACLDSLTYEQVQSQTRTTAVYELQTKKRSNSIMCAQRVSLLPPRARTHSHIEARRVASSMYMRWEILPPKHCPTTTAVVLDKSVNIQQPSLILSPKRKDGDTNGYNIYSYNWLSSMTLLSLHVVLKDGWVFLSGGHSSPNLLLLL